MDSKASSPAQGPQPMCSAFLLLLPVRYHKIMSNGGSFPQTCSGIVPLIAAHHMVRIRISSTSLKSRSRAGRGRFIAHLLSFLLWGLALSGLALGAWQAKAEDHDTAHAKAHDTLTLADGEQLIGKLIKVHAGTVTFHSDLLGDLTIPLAKVKTLHAAQFAVIEKDQRITRKTAVEKIMVGTIAIENETIHVSPPKAEERAFPEKGVDSLIDAASFHHELRGERDFFYGWTGPITLGASLVESTNSAQTYTGSVSLVRAIPADSWMPPVSRTILNLRGTYGLAKNPQIVMNNTILQAASTAKTDILHGGAEYDRYGSTEVFAFVKASADHNFGSGLELQQAYGGGIGWSVLNNPKNSLDLKANMQFEQQQFYNGAASQLGTPTENLASAAINETWKRDFAHKMKFNEYFTVTPAFNVSQAYSAVANTNFLFPVYKKLNFTLASTDNYLGDPPKGYIRNTFQFIAGITYVVK